MFSFAANILSNSATNIKKKRGNLKPLRKIGVFLFSKIAVKEKRNLPHGICFVMAKETKY